MSNNPACEFCVDCNRYGHTAEWCPGTTTQPDPEKMKMLQAWEASNPEFHCTKPGETEADDLLLDVHLCAFKSGYTAQSHEPTDADLEKLGNLAMEFLVTKYGHPQSGAFVNWQARPEEIALEMAEFTYRVQSQLVAERTCREAYEEMVAQAYRIEFTDYERIIEKYGDENSKTGIVWQVEDENNQHRFSKHGTALEAFKQIQKATKDESI